VQESGRAGRDGLEAECLLLFSGRDAAVWRMLIEKGEADAAAGALDALNAMAAFCSGTACRHRALVEHFGQRLDREPCGACDVCLDELDVVDDALVLAQKILSCVVRLGERFGGDYTAKVLAGSQEQRIVDAGHDQLSTYGLLGDHPHAAIRAWIDQLVSQDFLAKVGEDQFKTLSLTNRGRQLLRGEGDPRLLQPAKRRRDDRRSRDVAATVDSWEGVDRELFERLRKLRTDLSAERGVPPYVVFGDAALRDMARRRPSTLDNFLQVRGVGQRKREEFGRLFVEAIGAYAGETGVALDIVPATESSGSLPSVGRVGEGAERRSGPALSAVAAFEHFRRGASIDEVMQRLSRARSTVYGYLNEYLRHEQVTDPSPWLDAATVRRIEMAIDEVGAQRLKPIFDRLDGQVPYDQVRIVATCVANRLA
jgi:ATP-dependent DNA helicase RecQ